MLQAPAPEGSDDLVEPGAQIRDTSDLEIPVPPRAMTSSSTARVDTPWT